MCTSPFGNVRAHPEIVELLRSLGDGDIRSEAVYEAIRRIVDGYLPRGESLASGEFVGNLIVGKLLGGPAPAAPRGEPGPPSDLAADRGVWIITGVLGLVSADATVSRGAMKLFDGQLAKFFPPPRTPFAE
jgi:hypothetical protein